MSDYYSPIERDKDREIKDGLLPLIGWLTELERRTADHDAATKIRFAIIYLRMLATEWGIDQWSAKT